MRYLAQLDSNFHELLADNYACTPYIHEPQILLGSHIMFQLIKPESCHQLPSGRTLMSTAFGYVVTGCETPSLSQDIAHSIKLQTTNTYLTDTRQLSIEPNTTRSTTEVLLDRESYYSLEHIGISAKKKTQTTDKQARTPHFA
jgi:hypothetical protein